MMKNYDTMNSNMDQTSRMINPNGWNTESMRRYGRNERTPLLGDPRRQATAETMKVYVSVILLLFILIGGAATGIYLLAQQNNGYMVHHPFNLIDRRFWGAAENFSAGPLLNQSIVTTIALFHTRSPMCYNTRMCSLVLRDMQVMYNTTNHADIPYNFLIGGDGKTYEGKGWLHQSGFEALPFKNITLTVALIGDFTHSIPLFAQTEEIKSFVSESIRRRRLSSNYVMKGVREKAGDAEAMFQFFSKNLDRWDYNVINVK